jgi:hypothetical protein
MLLEQTESLGLHSAKNEWMSTGDVKEWRWQLRPKGRTTGGYELETKGKEKIVEAGSDRAFVPSGLAAAGTPCWIFSLTSLWPGWRAAAPQDVFLATDPLESTTRAGIAMEVLTSSGGVVSLETESQSDKALGLNLKRSRTTCQR